MNDRHYFIDEIAVKEKYTTHIDGISPFDIGIPLIETDDKTIE